MTKAELITSIAKNAGLTKAQSEKAVNAFQESVTSCLSGGDSIVIPGFGSFTVSQRAARQGRNPQTGQVIQIPASNVAKFRPGKALKEAVNK